MLTKIAARPLKRRRLEPSNSNSSTQLVETSSFDLVPALPGIHVCSLIRNCEFELIETHTYRCCTSGLVHRCGPSCNVALSTEFGRQCRVTGLLIDQSTLQERLNHSALIRGDAILLDLHRRDQLHGTADAKELASLHPRAQVQAVEDKAWQAIKTKDVREEQTKRSVALKRLLDLTAAQQRTKDPLDQHRCSPQDCLFTRHAELGDVYSCVEFGRVHVCGQQCDAATEDRPTVEPEADPSKHGHLRDELRASSGPVPSRVCGITGHVIDAIIAPPGFEERQQMQVDRLSVKTITSTTGKTRKPRQPKTSSSQQPPVVAHEQSRSFKVLQTMEQIVYHLLYSDVRRRHDWSLYLRAWDDAARKVTDYCREQTDCGQPISAIHMSTIFIGEIRERCANVRLFLQPDEKRVKYYAQRCMQFWMRLIPTLTTQPCVTNRMRDYVSSFLYFQRDGLMECNQVILDSDDYLVYAKLPDKTALDTFDIKSGHYVSMRKQVRDLITSVLRHTTIETLRLPLSAQELSKDWKAAEQMIASSSSTVPMQIDE